MADALRVGVVGCGVIFPLNVVGYQRTGKADIVALCDTDREPSLTCADATKVLQFALAAYRSHDEQRPIRPDDIQE